eukprot:8536636-Alexandrium_andersonii.AAC.1
MAFWNGSLPEPCPFNFLSLQSAIPCEPLPVRAENEALGGRSTSLFFTLTPGSMQNLLAHPFEGRTGGD